MREVALVNLQHNVPVVEVQAEPPSAAEGKGRGERDERSRVCTLLRRTQLLAEDVPLRASRSVGSGDSSFRVLSSADEGDAAEEGDDASADEGDAVCESSSLSICCVNKSLCVGLPCAENCGARGHYPDWASLPRRPQHPHGLWLTGRD